jgi:Protein of unknown function (DUF3307)
MFFYLLVGHALMDFALQPTPMAIEKSRRSKTELQKEVPWYYWLTAHAFLHGGAVAYITSAYTTSSIGLGILETVCHWIIDFVRGEGWIGIFADQALHVACKIGWWAMIAYGATLNF